MTQTYQKMKNELEIAMDPFYDETVERMTVSELDSISALLDNFKGHVDLALQYRLNKRK